MRTSAPKCQRNETPSWWTRENDTSSDVWQSACHPRLTWVLCFLRRRAPISMTAGRAWPSALSRLCTTPRLFSWSTTPEPSTPTAHFVSRNVHVSPFKYRTPVRLHLLEHHSSRNQILIFKLMIQVYNFWTQCQLKLCLSSVKYDTWRFWQFIIWINYQNINNI